MECKENQHKRRDNKYGITWCVKCGRLFTKPSNILLLESDKVYYTKVIKPIQDPIIL